MVDPERKRERAEWAEHREQRTERERRERERGKRKEKREERDLCSGNQKEKKFFKGLLRVKDVNCDFVFECVLKALFCSHDEDLKEEKEQQRERKVEREIREERERIVLFL